MGLFGFVPVDVRAELCLWLFIAPPFFAFGAGAAWAALDLDFGNAFFHYSFYVFVVVFLRFVGNLGMDFGM